MIRQSIKDDIPSLLKLSEDTGLFPTDHLEMLREMLTDFFTQGDEQERFWLTDIHADKTTGIAMCEPELMTFGTWNIRLIAIAPALQGNGRGGLLLQYVEEYLRSKDARLLIVDTSGIEDFAPVRSFYKKYGYSEESRIRNFFDEGDDKVTFSKQLG